MESLLRQRLSETVQALFPAGVAAGVARIGEGGEEDLLDEERGALARMVPQRKAEYIAGRLALRRAQRALSLPGFSVPNGPDRSPHWPPAFCGSISHAAGLAVAILSRQSNAAHSLGIDIEEDIALPAELLGIVLCPDERALLAREDTDRLARIVFAAKEAVYKAQYPLSLRLFGFDAVAISLDTGQGRFDARFTTDIAPFSAGDRIAGRYSACDGLILAGVALGALHP